MAECQLQKNSPLRIIYHNFHQSKIEKYPLATENEAKTNFSRTFIFAKKN